MLLTILQGDALEHLRALPNESVQCCVTSPPYFSLRDYGVDGQIGMEPSPAEYVAEIVNVMREVRRVLKGDGTLWLNLGDTYCSTGGAGGTMSASGLVGGDKRQQPRPETLDPEKFGRWNRKWGNVKSKDLVGIPWMVAFALRDDGWWLRSDIIWHKPNPMPESVTDRPTKAHEYLFLLTKSQRYYYDADAIKEHGTEESWFRSLRGNSDNHKQLDVPGRTVNSFHLPRSRKTDKENCCTWMRNKRSVWTITTQPYPDVHFATYPPDLIKPCILAGSRPGDVILDPFAGSGTTGMVALELGRKATLIELNPDYVKLIEQRCNITPGFAFDHATK